jgi:HK97 family phage prohead protease
MSEALMLSDGSFDILKSDELVIGGYASIEIVDKQNDLITLKALNEAVSHYMKDPKYRNVMSNHSNVQVGDVIEKYRDKNGMLHKTEVDDVGFYVVIKLRDDIEKAKEISRGIRKGTLRSFSIGGQALSKRKKSNDELGEFNEIDKLELHEVTICEKGINPEAKFDILKEDNEMTERLEKALEELNGLMAEVNDLKKEEEAKPSSDDGEKEAMSYESMDTMDDEPDNEGEDIEMSDTMDDETAKMRSGPEGSVEHGYGEDLEAGKKHTQAAQVGQLYKEWQNDDFATLDLSVENVEKAYDAFKAEQLEKMAYDTLKSKFESRFATEQNVRKSDAARAGYDAKNEVETLREEFAMLRKSLTEQNEKIVKSQTVQVPNFDVTNMSWGEIHNIVSGFEE